HAPWRCGFAGCRFVPGSPLRISAREGSEFERHREARIEAPARVAERVGRPFEAGFAEGHGVDARLRNDAQQRACSEWLETEAESHAVAECRDVAGRVGAGAPHDFGRELPRLEVDAAVGLPHVARRDPRGEAPSDGEPRAPVEQRRESEPAARLIARIEFAELAGERDAEPAE